MPTIKKEEIRRQILDLLRNQKEEDRLRKSLVILEKLFATPEFQNSKTILFYASFAGEVETFTMMTRARQLGKKIALPTVLLSDKKIIPIRVDDNSQLEKGTYGIQQPRFDQNRCLDTQDVDLCLVPGVAFDRQNNRLGRGGGYYDRFLRQVSATTPAVGLAFQFQVLDCLPQQEHDMPVSCVITE